MEGAVQRIPLQVARDCVVASVQVELTEDLLRDFRADLLNRLADSNAKGVIIDVSGLAILDKEDFETLRRTMAMAEIMGARPVIAGLNPGVISALITLGAEVDEIEAAQDLDDAFRLIEATDSEGGEVSAEEETDDQERDSYSNNG